MGAGGSQQVHDFNPGEENGLFWTIRLPNDSVDGEFEDGEAALRLRDFDIDDYGNVGNALTGGSEIASASLNVELRWRGLSNFVRFVNSGLPTPFAASELQGVNSGATMRWSAVENGHHFSGALNTADFAVLASERNGLFFRAAHD